MKILGREIHIGKILPLIGKFPKASFFGIVNKARQNSFDFFASENGASLFPSTICIEITYNCNLRCKTCWFYGNSGIFKGKKINQHDELSFDQLKKLINDISAWKPYIYITGGEPLINKNTIPLIKYAVKKGLIVGMVTNGVLINKKNAEKIISSGLSFLTISIDGPKNVHNSIRETNCFDDAISGLKNIVEKRNNAEKKFPIITLNCTISNENYSLLEEVADIAKDSRADVLALQHSCFLREKTIKAHNISFKKIFKETNSLIEGYKNDEATQINVDKLYKIISKIKKQHKSFGLRLYQDFDNRDLKKYYTSESPINKRCINSWFSATIKPNGDVTPCLGYVVGNLNKSSFMQIWNNKKFKHFRKILKQKKFFPGCIRCCGFFLNWNKNKK